MQGELPPPELGAASVDGLPSTLLLQGEGGAAAPIEHINFWKEEEISNLNAQHPEVEGSSVRTEFDRQLSSKKHASVAKQTSTPWIPNSTSGSSWATKWQAKRCDAVLLE
eukprot:1158919-Pelagomonas_calceolata.AAC.3